MTDTDVYAKGVVAEHYKREAAKRIEALTAERDRAVELLREWIATWGGAGALPVKPTSAFLDSLEPVE